MRCRDRFASLLAAALLAAVAGPALAAEECVAASIDEVGRCGRRGAAATAGLHDRETPRPAPPPGLDPDLLATQLLGDFAVGELHPVAGGDGEWVLVARQAAVVAVDANAYALREQGPEPSVARVALLGWREGAGEGALPTVRILAETADPTEGTAAAAVADGAGAVVPCVDPEAGGELDSAGGYPDIAGEFRWRRLSPQHRVLAASVRRSEGYAGGGGGFHGEVLLEPRDGRLVPVACYARSRFQMFGGEWNEDGTRQHPESRAAWEMRVLPGGEWPRLRLHPVTADTPAAALRWDPARGHYVRD
ncbi:hypothetical protein [Vulcaniibacterium tengchongense]|uniref:Uncharacterized protein n=1 Tax=Vulcaniibacterium tengchongense TaxID=1273429 RepID=A0A3N4VG62_9GAMM|nr:hypothetical protein [Vulcaniibacterium tengchongense]RPE82012.1 hypothetical protein EDC50_1215 [Vulcaniibacterium tengchongense]